MKDSVKLGAAVAGGYLLGRTKKGKAAIGLALWLSGKRIGNSREMLARLAASPELARLTAQVRGPLLEAAQRAVTATIESRTTTLADSLQQRTARLIDGTVTAVRDADPQERPAARDADPQERPAPRTRSARASKARRDDRSAEAAKRQERVDLLDGAVDDNGGDPAEGPAQPEVPRQAKPRGRAPRRSPAARTAEGLREPGRRRREPRDDG